MFPAKLQYDKFLRKKKNGRWEEPKTHKVIEFKNNLKLSPNRRSLNLKLCVLDFLTTLACCSFWKLCNVKMNFPLIFLFFQVSALRAEFSSESCRVRFLQQLALQLLWLLGQFQPSAAGSWLWGCCQEEAQFETKKVLLSSISLP